MLLSAKNLDRSKTVICGGRSGTFGVAVTRDFESRRGINRRDFLRYSASTGAVLGVGGSLASSANVAVVSQNQQGARSFEWEEATIGELQAAMRAGDLTSQELTRAYVERIHDIDWPGPQLNSVMEINPDAIARRQATSASGLVAPVFTPITSGMEAHEAHHRPQWSQRALAVVLGVTEDEGRPRPNSPALGPWLRDALSASRSDYGVALHSSGASSRSRSP